MTSKKTATLETSQEQIQQETPPDLPARKHENWPLIVLIIAFIPFVFANAIFLSNHLAHRNGLLANVKQVYNFNTLYYPIMLASLALVSLRLRPSRRARLLALLALAAAILMYGARIYATHIEPNWLRVRLVSIHSPKIRTPLRLLHISDIQSAGIGSHEKRAFAQMRRLQPDLIIHTGDLLHPVRPATVESELPKIINLFRTLDPRLGILNVMGDTDYGLNPKPLKDEAHVDTLIDLSREINVADSNIKILGLSLEASRGGDETRNIVKRWLSECKPEDFTILCGHSPDFILSTKDLPIDLCLAGHTHGGQVRVPFYGPPVIMSRIPRQWARGFHDIDRTHLNVSAGISAEHLHELPSIRFNCPPEMTLIEIQPDR